MQKSRSTQPFISRRKLLGLTASAVVISATGLSISKRALAQLPELADVQALVFDVFGTVADWRGTIIQEGNQLNARKGYEVDWGEFADRWRSGYGPAMNQVRSGELPWTKLDDLHRMVLDELIVEFGLTDMSESEIQHLNRVWHRLTPWPDAIAGLTRLREKYTIAPLSNGNVSLLLNMAKNAGLPFDTILSAELSRHYKPDPEAYLKAAELFSLRPEQVMLVAAHPSDLRGAARAGLRTAYVHRPMERGPERPTIAPARDEFDLFADDFIDLAEQLGA
ncbi:haloacid dehalogenase type II [Pseudohongiella sp. SYSU M77423]|uniref:haloacid dehalogenase type II n=1 Tax=Pseudohongiella sp. SYSU M77423 TaxID=3042312 RepID=UPI00247FBBB5|nr:haloacid dehalogenase type II [Pseudohongiella sp. SYSU M77423]MDH7942541.1 haloacid dehalogenase type II [Pseudohongiella sp. SYSU M77423]